MKNRDKKTALTTDLYTPEGELLAADTNCTPWADYPRPHLKRNSYFCLNGQWELFSLKDTTGVSLSDLCRTHIGNHTDPSTKNSCARPDRETKTAGCEAISQDGVFYEGEVRVPFVPQSLLSGIHKNFSDDTVLYYKKSFSFAKKGSGSRALLHIDGADRDMSLFLNGHPVGSHFGGYDPAVFDVTRYLSDENHLEVFVRDSHKDVSKPYGKQRENRGGMWYTPVSGIWQTVWIEEVPSVYVSEIRVKTDLFGADVTVEMSDGSRCDGDIVLRDGEETLKVKLNEGRGRVEPKEPKLWSPEAPHLYEFSVKVGEDTVDSYFALRTVTVEKCEQGRVICLNGKPYFFHGVLDQGYFSDGIFLPATPGGFERDILKAKELGFNMLRKHIKVEPELFYYACDRLGMIVFQDMVNCGDYSFIRDTALPTVGFKHRNDKKLHRDPETRREFIDCMEKTVLRLSFHPSVCYWTIFNEGWGQFDHADAYRRLKNIDGTRPVDSVSGRFFSPKGTVSDVDSRHVYFKKVKIRRTDKPVILSEFGGYSYKVEGHSFNLSDNYGYGSYESAEAFENALIGLYTEQIIPAIRDGLCGTVYTQISDVEDETNGLMTYDRKVTKVSASRLRELSESLKKGFSNAYK